MSGHSKWSSIKHKKAIVDAKRGASFTKYIKEITVAAKIGGADPDANPRLRSAILAARGANMPKDNIQRAVQKGAGGGESDNIEEIRYEGYAQGGVAIIIDCITDNRNRTVADVRSTLTKAGGSLGESGCVAWMFHQMGVFVFNRENHTEDEIMEIALEGGADDVEDKPDEDMIEVRCAPTEFGKVQNSFESAGKDSEISELSWIPENTIDISGETAEKVINLIEKIEDLDDVQNVYANYNISQEELERLSA